MGNRIITKWDEAEMKKKIKIKTRVKMSKRYERAIKSGKSLCISCRRSTDSVFRQCLPQIGHALIFYPCYNDFIWFVWEGGLGEILYDSIKLRETIEKKEHTSLWSNDNTIRF